ncbi:hypothetical protein [Dysgonomonas sp. 520]|uniref:hypothetical protein n=1 Tax=Dysgonomonas sp. 520 TaxID=2302931 RepID=UPI0013D74A68|nr:hypothetical protein [Dysgonomonas sp. 520]NDW10480.1 hypothetical protein [Dysgonomonas sp. 520]
MKASQLKIESIYVYSDGQTEMHVSYFGMSSDKYMFIPYDTKKKHYTGRPNSLTESEVNKYIKTN